MYLGEQKAAGFDFSASIRLKQASFLAGEVDQEYEEEENEKKVFINQMRFNLALCLAIGGNHSEAATQLAKCEV